VTELGGELGGNEGGRTAEGGFAWVGAGYNRFEGSPLAARNKRESRFVTR